MCPLNTSYTVVSSILQTTYFNSFAILKERILVQKLPHSDIAGFAFRYDNTFFQIFSFVVPGSSSSQIQDPFLNFSSP
jgi:hypothetical protein